MPVTAFVFSGQGAQHQGMGLEFAAADPKIEKLFAAAEEHRPGTLEQLRSGSPEVLNATENTQPCLYLADVAAALYLSGLGLRPELVAGFSLGEIPALAFSGAFSPEEGFRIVCQRGKLMGAAAKEQASGMAAVLRLSDGQVEEICRAHGIFPVNYNSPGQLVVSGESAALSAATADFTAAGGRVMPLRVSGAFHSPLMSGAARAFEAYLSERDSRLPEIPVYANRTAKPYAVPPHLALAAQIDSPVRWTQTVQNMAKAGAEVFVEVGVGNTLAKLVSRILPGARVYSAETPSQAQEIAREVAKNA